MDAYNVFDPSRSIRDFIGELSQWYIHRSRDRFKSADEADKQYAIATTRTVLETLAKVMAPFTPFAAEMVYQKVKKDGGAESVHLTDWPEGQKIDDALLAEMGSVRQVISLGLEARAKTGIKVRQPLAKITVPALMLGAAKDLMLDLIRDELNVKE